MCKRCWYDKQLGGVLNEDGWLRLCGGDIAKDGTGTGCGDKDAAEPFLSPTLIRIGAAGAINSRGDSGGGRSGGENAAASVSHVAPTSDTAGPAGLSRNGGGHAKDSNEGEVTGPPRGATTAPTAGATADASAAASSAPAALPESVVLEMDVVVNPPAVTSLDCGVALPMAGFSIVAEAEMEFGTVMGWEWLREGLGGHEGGIEAGVGENGRKGGARQAGGGGSPGERSFVCTTFVFVCVRVFFFFLLIVPCLYDIWVSCCFVW